MEVDKQAYRVTYICKCANDYAEGYGSTVVEAEANVRRFWRRDQHKLSDIAERVVERVTEDGSHYEEEGTK